ERQRVYRLAGHADLEVEVRAGGVARAPHERDGLAGGDDVPDVHKDLRGVRVVVLGVTVLDDHEVTVAAVPAGLRHDPAGGGHDGVAGVAVDVEAGVPVRAADAEGAVTVARGDRSREGPDQARSEEHTSELQSRENL